MSATYLSPSVQSVSSVPSVVKFCRIRARRLHCLTRRSGPLRSRLSVVSRIQAKNRIAYTPQDIIIRPFSPRAKTPLWYSLRFS